MGDNSAFIVGIDLGTTHSAMAAVEPHKGAGTPVVDLPVPQLLRPFEVSPRPLLPSTLYQPAGPEFPEGSLELPWPWGEPYVVGELARWQGANVPGRLISSAKSWLCHPGVDRSAAILPWAAREDVAKLSPVDASAKILAHLRSAWDHQHPGAPLAEQEVVLTVPASFDEAARALTVTAAQRAGLGRFTLLEEPQAAFYDFTGRHRTDLAQALKGVRLVLVVDVGGGTTDFTLVHVGVSPEGPVLRRLAVGEHLMLGGDNMDAALAHALEAKLLGQGKRLSASHWMQLVQGARAAKESLLGHDAPETQPVPVALGGSKLVGGTTTGELTRAEAEGLVLDGFFPQVTATDLPRKSARGALQELGLPYAQEPAVTRHLVAFLAQHAQASFAALGESEAGLPRPDAILLNGGVFNSPQISARLVEAVSALWPSAPRVRLLRHDSLERAVARGAAYYGLVRRGMGLRIGGGAARAFYVGVGAMAGQGPTSALCLIPRGFEEGQSVTLKDKPFQLSLGRPVQFALYSTTSDRVDTPGSLVELGEELKPLPPIHTLLKSAQGKTVEVPVHLTATLTEIGTLELSCVSEQDDERWRLEFELRGASARGELTVTESMPARFGEAREDIDRVYGHKPMAMGTKDVKQLFRGLEKTLGPREGWRLPVLRELWSALFSGAAKRRRSADHERVFFQLAGFMLRPGFGYPLDAWRADQTFRFFKDLVQFHAEKPSWVEFWVMWRRISGGLSEDAQGQLWGYLKPHLERRLLPETKKLPKLKGIQPEGLDEMVRTAASLEHLPSEEKELLGRWISSRLTASEGGGPWGWALGRIGARGPLYGSVHRTVPAELAAEWVDLLLARGLRQVDGAPFAVAQLARRTGDRARDLDEGMRARVVQALIAAQAPDSFVRMVTDVKELEATDEARALGDTLPVGLRLG
jgi:molecular chaperone DnaK (HSP70)